MLKILFLIWGKGYRNRMKILNEAFVHIRSSLSATSGHDNGTTRRPVDPSTRNTGANLIIRRMKFVIFILLCTFCITLLGIKINPSSKKFVDENGRIRFFHGVNAVYKIAPWHPTTSGFDSNNTLSLIDAQNLNAYGLNIVRLGVMWPGVEPTTRGAFDQSYLDNIETIVDNLNKKGIFVILDMHQVIPNNYS